MSGALRSHERMFAQGREVGSPLMGSTLVVIVGAGGTRDCASDEAQTDAYWLPPLVVDLFKPMFRNVLRFYPRVQAVAPAIRDAARDGGLSLEDFLRDELGRSSSADDRQAFWQVPLYLQHLLWEVSERYTGEPDNYHRLVRIALTRPRVVFLTLNYDLHLDQALSAYTAHSIEASWDYISQPQWCLGKMHGSVNWVRPLRAFDDIEWQSQRDPYAATFIDRVVARHGVLTDSSFQSIEVIPRWDVNMSSMRIRGDAVLFPAVSVPLGPADSGLWPADHEKRVLTDLGAEDSMDLLVIGYSGLDHSVLRCLRQADRPVRRMAVINHDGDAGGATADRRFEFIGSPGSELVIEHNGFDTAARSGAIAKFVGSLD